MTTIDFQPGRSTASDVTFRLGLASFRFDLVSAMPENKEDTAFKMACPGDHGKGKHSRVTQRYVCDHSNPIDAANRLAEVAAQVATGAMPLDALDGAIAAVTGAHPLLEQHECIKIREHQPTDDDGNPTGDPTWVAATKDDIIAANVGTLDKGDMVMSVHPADQVLTTCRPGRKGYLLRPSKTKKEISATDQQMYGALRAFIERRPDLMFVGSLRLRDARSVYRITVFDGQLYAEELVLPDKIRARDPLDVDVDDTTVGLIEQLAEATLADFDANAHTWDAAAAVKELVARNAATENGEAPAAPAKPAPVADVTDMLRQALAAA